MNFFGKWRRLCFTEKGGIYSAFTCDQTASSPANLLIGSYSLEDLCK